MFAFEIWGKFASFRDPLTISQNITLPIPPKTTVAGMMASILGIEEYFDDEAFSAFEYSIVVLEPIRKKSFSQNYINDYTSKVQTQLNSLEKEDYQKIGTGFRDKKNPQKPINRELLLNPNYLVLVNNFKYEEQITNYLKEKISKFPFYLGNSEFAGNFKYREIQEVSEYFAEEAKVDSFILESDLNSIVFTQGVRYSKLSFATALDRHRTPTVFTSVIIGSKGIGVKSLAVESIVMDNRVYHCRFV